MPKIVFNNCPKKFQPFPFQFFDNEIDLKDIALSYHIYDEGSVTVCSLGIALKGGHLPIANIELYHSKNLSNFEETADSAEILLKEIVRRFNSFREKGQLCLELL